jgi:hypothetical protein
MYAKNTIIALPVTGEMHHDPSYASVFALCLGTFLLFSGCSDDHPSCTSMRIFPSPAPQSRLHQFLYKKSPELMTGEKLDAYADSIMASGATIVLINTQAQRTNYASEAFEPFWQGYEPAAGDDQPFLAGIPPEGRTGYGAWSNACSLCTNRALIIQAV